MKQQDLVAISPTDEGFQCKGTEEWQAGTSTKFQMEKKTQAPINETLQIKNSNAEHVLNPVIITELDDNELWPLSGKPYFDVIIGRTQLKPSYQVYLPAKVHRSLPSALVPVVLSYRGKNWAVSYSGNSSHKRFDTRWKQFVFDNHLKLGDACVFELTECSSANLKFKVQILRGNFPSELLAKVSGVSPNAPIVIEQDDHPSVLNA